MRIPPLIVLPFCTDIHLNRPRRKLWITGHSLGGALATLFIAKMMLVRASPFLLMPTPADLTLRMQDFPDSEDNIGGVYTFGQPRLGDVYDRSDPSFCVR